MASPKYRFTLNNSVKGSQVFTIIDGWKDLALVLERDPEFHSLVELVETPLIFLGESKDYVIDVADNQGVDSIVELTIDISYDELTYTTVFEGTLSLEEMEEEFRGSSSYSVKVPIVQNLFWQKFMNRKDTKINFNSNLDLDGGTRQTILSTTLNLTPQVLRKRTKVRTATEMTVGHNTYAVRDGQTSYAIDGFESREFDEILSLIQYPSQVSDLDPIESEKYYILVKETEEGVYNFDIDIDIEHVISNLNDLGLSRGAIGNYSIQWYLIHITGDDSRTSYTIGSAVSGSAPGNLLQTVYTRSINQDISLIIGDKIFLYSEITADNYTRANINTTGPGAPVLGTNLSSPCWLRTSSLLITADTSFPGTITSQYKIHEAMNKVTNAVIAQNGSFYSEYLGNKSTAIQTYTSNGGGSFIGLIRGINVRGYNFSEKPFSASFMDLWDGINPLENLGCGYETISGVDLIRVEEKEHFYDNTPSLTISNIELIRKVDPEIHVKKVKCGFKKWKAEEIGLIDDPQTKHEYATRFKTFGKEETIESSFYAAGLGIEQTRRKSILESEDWKLDDEIMMISLDRSVDVSDNPTGLSNPEVFAGSPAPSGIINGDTRYNLRYTPKRSLLRWGNILSAGLLPYAASEYIFVYGEGNFDFLLDLNDSSRGDYNNLAIAENDNLAWDYGGSPLKSEQKPIFTKDVYDFEVDFTYDEYEAIRNNRKRSIEISETDTGHFSVFIERLSYTPFRGKCQFKVRRAT